MKILEDIKEMLEDELRDIKKKGTHTPAEFDFMKTAVETIGKIEEICDKHEIGTSGYSGRHGNYSGYNRMGGRYYGYSGANMMPMDSYDGNYYGGTGYYGQNYPGRMGRYSGHNEPGEKVVRELREMLDRPMSDYEREVIMKTIDELSR